MEDTPDVYHWVGRPVAAAKAPGRPKIDADAEALVVRMAQENRRWGNNRVADALANLGYTVSDQTVGNILKRHGFPPSPERKKTTTWEEFIHTHGYTGGHRLLYG